MNNIKFLMEREAMKIMKWLNSLIIAIFLFTSPALAQYKSANPGTQVDSAVDQVQAATTSSAGAGDSGKLIELDASGLLDDSFIPAAITRDAEWDTIGEIETATGVDVLVDTEVDTEAEFETLLFGVFTPSDGALDDDDVTDDNVESMATAGGSGSAPVSDGASGLSMTDIATQAEQDALQTDDLWTLTNLTIGDVNFGSFTGSTISDNSTLKPILQELETAVEGAGSGSVEDDAYGAGWDADTANAPSQNAIYDYLHQFDADDDGSLIDESWFQLDNMQDVSGTGTAGNLMQDDGDGTYSFSDSLTSITITLGDDADTTEGRIGFDATNDIFEVFDGSTALNVGTLKGPATGDTYTNFGEAADNTVDSLLDAIDNSWPSGSGAPTDAPYITSAANATLSNETVLSDEASLYGLLSDVTDFVQASENNDSADDVTDDNVESMTTAGGSGTAPVSDGAGGLAMTNVWTESENTAASYIDSTGVTYENLNTNGDVGTGASQVAAGDHDHSGTYEPTGDRGISNDNLVEMDDADAADDDYARFTANGLEGRSASETRADLAGISNSPSDGSFDAVTTIEGTAGEALSFGDVVFSANNAGAHNWYAYEATTAADGHAFARGIVVESGGISSSATGTIMLEGTIQDTGWSMTGNSDEGSQVYASDTTAGGILTTAPADTDDIVQILGFVLEENIIYFDPDYTTVVVP